MYFSGLRIIRNWLQNYINIFMIVKWEGAHDEFQALG